MRGYRIVCLPWYDQSVAISLNRLDLLKQQFEPIEFTADLRLDILRYDWQHHMQSGLIQNVWTGCWSQRETAMDSGSR